MQARSEYQTILSGKPIIAVFIGFAGAILGVLGSPLDCPAMSASQDNQAREWQAIDFQEANRLYQAALKAVNDRQWQTAADSLQRFITMIPDEFSSRVLLARCWTKLGETQAALDELHAAVELGWEDAATLSDSADFETLRADGRFRQIRETMKTYRGAKFVVVLPRDHQPSDNLTQLPVVLYFHGRAESPRSSIPQWQPIADELGLCIVLPKGTRRFGQGYVWDAADAKGNEPWKLDHEGARKAARDALAGLKQEQRIEPSQICFAGFSQGAVVAAALATEGEENDDDLSLTPDSVLLMSGAFSPEPDFKLPGGLKVAQFVGREEQWLAANQALRDSLQRQQVQLRYHELDAGHDVPRPFAKIIAPLLRDFLLAEPDAQNDRH